MQLRKHLGMLLSGGAAGAVNGLFGAGGGMVLVPMLTGFTKLPEAQVFPTSVSVILPVCLVSLALSQSSSIPWDITLPYLTGSCLGGILAGILAKKIPTLWLHRILGALILWGGVRYLC